MSPRNPFGGISPKRMMQGFKKLVRPPKKKISLKRGRSTKRGRSNKGGQGVYESFAKVSPRHIRQKFDKLMIYSDINADPTKFLGFIVFSGFAFGFVIAYVLNAFDILPLIFAFPLAFVLIEFSFYIMIQMSIDSKAKFVERVLPDALQLMSSNIRAGLTTDKALLMAARPEFGPLSEEIKRIGRETMTGRSLASALLKTTERIRSDSLEKTMDLIVSSLRSGGKLADLLDQISDDLRDQQMMQSEIAASVLMYVIFIFIAVGMGAPLLFAMSSFLVKLLIGNMQAISEGMPEDMEMAGAPISMTDISLDPAFIGMYAIISLCTSSFFGALIIGLILHGSAKSGIKFIFILLGLSIGLFFLGGYILDLTLGGMMEI